MRVPEVLSAVTTPFLADGDVDLLGFRRNLERLEKVVDGVFVAGTTGEFPALDDTEHALVVEVALEVFGPDRTVVHVGAPSIRQAVRLTRRAARQGACRAAALTPYYLPASTHGITRYWGSVTEVFDGEVYGYVFPDVAGTDLLPEHLAEVLSSGVKGVKVSGTASQRVADYLAGAPGDFKLWSGNDADLPQVLAAGGVGTVSGVSSVCPAPWARLREAFRADDEAGIAAAQQIIETIVPILGPSIAHLKYGLDLLGQAGGPCRMVIDAPTAHKRTLITEAIRLGTQ